ncbi:hypothetical protein [Actinoplanes flavus]|uniref:DUF222 domain-containing protein n=1 Tax=Actinoplanes flavus TaxID=2820290 RepID=A0ABS3V087_9ACTN|nr:hypothetical protein [Actinoplanes flavus]MBO3744240.1 hypothetical protein [Actinoplanes flavus]
MDEALDRLYRTVYRAARAGEINRTDAFDLAASVLELKPADPDAGELASLSLDGAGVSRSRMAELALTLLEEAGFRPGFTEEPEWLTRLEDAMRLVNQDVAATGLPDRCRLRVDEDHWPGHNGNAHAETWDGHAGTGGGIVPASGADPVSALVAVAEDAQDAVMHSLWSVWPVCPVHRLGVHARSHDDAAVWWCGSGRHAVAAIGAWPDR